MNVKQDIRGLDYLVMALLAFGAVGLELVLVSIEPFIYGQPVDFNNHTVILHWILTCLCWGTSTYFLLKYAMKNYGFKLKDSSQPLRYWNYLAVIFLLILSCTVSYLSWNGFKPYIEFSKLGALKFSLQYVYYFFETMLFTLIIVFGQKAFEKWFKNANIPYGGILCSITWGLSHIYTKSSLEVGLLVALIGFGFGAVYLLLKRNIIITFPIIFLMFVL